jgi:Domain of unknown function (DUF4158)
MDAAGRRAGVDRGQARTNEARFALLLKFYIRAGRFPRGRGELPDDAVEFVARQVCVEPGELGLYEWSGRTIEYHRAQIRAHPGFRKCLMRLGGRPTPSCSRRTPR